MWWLLRVGLLTENVHSNKPHRRSSRILLWRRKWKAVRLNIIWNPPSFPFSFYSGFFSPGVRTGLSHPRGGIYCIQADWLHLRSLKMFVWVRCMSIARNRFPVALSVLQRVERHISPLFSVLLFARILNKKTEQTEIPKDLRYLMQQLVKIYYIK